MLSVRNLNQYYGQSHTLRDIDIELQRGQCLCLMGRNGVGKTTLLKVIMGLLHATSGTITFDTKDLGKARTEERARLGIAYVPQGRMIFPQLSVEENLMLSLFARKDKAAKIPAPIYDLFPVLHDMKHRRGGDLSGGQQQQLAIGRALCLDPVLLILDEPTEGIQPNIVHEIGDIIVNLNKAKNMTVLLVEQKLGFARRVSSDFCIMDKGRIVANGRIADLHENLVRKHLTV